MQSFIYLDHAAATPVDERVVAAMQPYWSEQFYNPSATYLPAQQVGKALEVARTKVASWLGARPSEVIFTAGGTEANNLAIRGIMDQYPDANVVVSAVEHDAVLVPARSYACREVAVLPVGSVDLESLDSVIDDQTVLVSVMYANNEVGTIQPLREISRLIQQKRQQRGQAGLPLYFHTDACQAGNYLDLHVSRLGVDLLTINGGKVYGPKQSGALYVSSKVALVSQITGGGQERNIRSGTQNVAQNIGLAVALDLAQQMRDPEVARLQKLQQHFIQAVKAAIPVAVVNGSLHKRLPNNVHVTFPDMDNERLLLELEEKGILAAAGSACSASNDEPSHVLRAMGLSDAAAQASIRFTLGRNTTLVMIDQTVQTLASLIVG